MRVQEIIGEGLDKWFRQNWVDISRKGKDGSHPACGDSAGKGRRKGNGQSAYPKCVPAGKAAHMSKSEKASASRRKREVERKPNADKKSPDYVKTEV
jgi:hypothetical protein